MTTSLTEKDQNKKIKWLSIFIGLLALLLVIQTASFVIYLNNKEKAELKRVSSYQSQADGWQGNTRARPSPLYTQRSRPAYDPFDFYSSHPLRMFQRMEDQMNQLFQGFQSSSVFNDMTPTIDLEETEKDYILRADLPGLEKDKIDVSVRGNLLTLRGERQTEATSENTESGYFAQERSYGSFARTIMLPGPVDESKITADYKEGVLKVTLPKLVGKEEKSKITVQ